MELIFHLRFAQLYFLNIRGIILLINDIFKIVVDMADL